MADGVREKQLSNHRMLFVVDLQIRIPTDSPKPEKGFLPPLAT
jgi:hypothetical protein